jgi:uncharacterized protein
MEFLDESDLRRRMEFDNPWWRDGKTASAFSELPKRDYFAPFFELVQMRDPHRSIVLSGPRRVGKTVMLHQALHLLAGSKPEAASKLCYLSLDTPVYRDVLIESLIHLFMARWGHMPDMSLTVFLDEIQYAENWRQQLKSLTDSFRNIKFVATGSAVSLLVPKGQESGAGRWTDFILRPMTFAEHLRLKGVEQNLIEIKNDKITTPDIHALNREFETYVNFGGYPELSLSTPAQHETERFLKADILDRVLMRDLLPSYGINDSSDLERLFRFLAYVTGQEVTAEKLSHGSGVSKNTVLKFLDFLEDAFLIARLQRVDDNGRNFKRPGTFKAYLAIPSLRTALFGPMSMDEDGFGHLVETAIMSQYLHDNNFKSRCRYARWDSGEVDLVKLHISDQRPFSAIEFKWTDRMLRDPSELGSLARFAKKNALAMLSIATSKTVTQDSLMVDSTPIRLRPAALFCYGVGKDITDYWLVDTGHKSPFEKLPARLQ